MEKISSLKPGDDGKDIEALITHVVTGKTSGNNRSTYLSITLQDASIVPDASCKVIDK